MTLKHVPIETCSILLLNRAHGTSVLAISTSSHKIGFSLRVMNRFFFQKPTAVLYKLCLDC